VYNYIKTNIWINYMFMVYITCFVVKAQINYIWSLEEFKMGEILWVSTFDIMCTSNFNTKCIHCTMEIPNFELVPWRHFQKVWVCNIFSSLLPNVTLNDNNIKMHVLQHHFRVSFFRYPNVNYVIYAKS
jgi:hypothetical protein